MSNVISSIIKQIAKTTAAAGLAITLAGGAASANEPTFQQRVEAEMLKGKDYSAAWSAASRAIGPSASPELAARIIRSETAMNEGKDYVSARDVSRPASVGYSAEAVAKAQRAEAAMNNEGKDYVAARDASDKAEPATTNVARSGVMTTAASTRSAR